MGGDCGYSIPLPDDTRVLWLFGDSYVRDDDAARRSGSRMVGNTVGLMTWDGVNQKMEYRWHGRGTGTPDAFFQSGSADWRYWPMDGFTIDDKLYVCLIRVRAKGGGALGFENFAVDLAEIPDPQDSPANWTVNIRNLFTSTSIFPGISTVVSGSYVYFFTVRDDDASKPNRPVFLTRIPLRALPNPAAGLQYLATNGAWKAGFVLSDAKQIMDKGVTEMTVRWHPTRNQWVAVQIDNRFPSPGIWRRTASSLTGPWSQPTTIYSFPEMSPSHPDYGTNRFFYAGKEHIEFATPHAGETVLTYVGNSFDWADVVGDMDIYVPKPVRFRMDTPTGKAPPSVAITSPPDQVVVRQSATLDVVVDASGGDGAISHVILYVNGVKSAISTSPPCQFNCADLALGTNVLMARAYDTTGSMSEAVVVVIVVPAPPGAGHHPGGHCRSSELGNVAGYRLQRSPGLEPANWQDIPGSQDQNHWTEAMQEPRMFFRLIK